MLPDLHEKDAAKDLAENLRPVSGGAETGEPTLPVLKMRENPELWEWKKLGYLSDRGFWLTKPRLSAEEWERRMERDLSKIVV